MARRTAAFMMDKMVSDQRRKTARRVSIICGLTLAAVASGVVYAALPWTPASSPAHGDQAPALRQLVSFTTAKEASSVQFSPDGNIVAAVTGDNQVQAWSTATGQQLITGVNDDVPPAARLFDLPVFGPAGDTFAILDTNAKTFSTAVDIWISATGRAAPLVQHAFFSSENSPGPVTPGPDGQLAYAQGNLVNLVSMTNRRSGGTLIGGSSLPQLIVFSPDGREIAATDGRGVVYLWDAASRRVVAKLTAERLYNDTEKSNPISGPDIGSITFSPDSRIVACGSGSGIIRVWDVATDRNISTFSIDGENPSGAAARQIETLIFSPDGRRLATSDNTGMLGVWDIVSGREIATLAIRSGKFASAAFTKSGTLLVATENNGTSGHEIEIWSSGKSLTAILPG